MTTPLKTPTPATALLAWTRRFAPLVLVHFLLLAACAHTKVECPKHGGAPWVEIRSRNFELRTNLGSAEARKTVLELEKARAVLQDVIEGSPRAFRRTRVIALRSVGELREFTGRTDVAGLVHGRGRNLLLVLGGDSGLFDGRPDLTIVFHELAHQLVGSVLSRQPRWFSEGMATYLETIRPWESAGEYKIGLVSMAHLSRARHGFLSLDTLWDLRADSGLSASDVYYRYASSWAWVHFLLNRHPNQMSAFQHRLAEGEEARRAWAAAFLGLSPVDLERELSQYLRSTQYSSMRYTPTLDFFQLEERPMSDADVHAARAQLFHASPRVKNVSELKQWLLDRQREVDEALTLDPNQALALEFKILAAGPGETSLALARTLTGSHPDSEIGWLLLGAQLTDAKERRQAYLKAQQLAPDHPGTLNGLAWDLVRSGEAEAALPLATRAVGLDPSDANLLDTLAWALAGLGRCAEVATVEQRISELQPSHSPESPQPSAKRKSAAEGCHERASP